jgi:hypothetical protein
VQYSAFLPGSLFVQIARGRDVTGVATLHRNVVFYTAHVWSFWYQFECVDVISGEYVLCSRIHTVGLIVWVIHFICSRSNAVFPVLILFSACQEVYPPKFCMYSLFFLPSHLQKPASRPIFLLPLQKCCLGDMYKWWRPERIVHILRRERK